MSLLSLHLMATKAQAVAYMATSGFSICPLLSLWSLRGAGSPPLQKAGGRNTTTRWIKHLKKSLRTWPTPASTRLFLRAQQHRHLNGTLPWKPTGLHIMVVSERTGMRVPTPRSGEVETTNYMARMVCDVQDFAAQSAHRTGAKCLCD